MKKFLVKAGGHLVRVCDFSVYDHAEVCIRIDYLIDGMRFFLPITSIVPSFNDLWEISGWLLEDDPDPCGFKLAYLDILFVPIDDEGHEIQKENIRIIDRGVVKNCTNICDNREELPFS